MQYILWAYWMRSFAHSTDHKRVKISKQTTATTKINANATTTTTTATIFFTAISVSSGGWKGFRVLHLNWQQQKNVSMWNALVEFVLVLELLSLLLLVVDSIVITFSSLFPYPQHTQKHVFSCRTTTTTTTTAIMFFLFYCFALLQFTTKSN